MLRGYKNNAVPEQVLKRKRDYKDFNRDPDLWKEIDGTWRDEWLPNIQVDIGATVS